MLLITLISLIFFFGILGYKKPVLALIAMPITFAFIMGRSLYTEQAEGIIFSPVIIFVALISVAVAKADPDSDQIPQRIARWSLAILGLLLFSFIGFALFGHLGSLFLILIVFIATVAISYGMTSRHATAAYVISTIGSSMRQNLPLTMALQTAATGKSDTGARILRRIKKWLVQGYSLSESIKKGYPKCPSQALAIITAAEKINQLPQVLQAIELNLVEKANNKKRVQPVHPLYPAVILLLMSFIVVGLMTFVIPKFNDVLQEMIGAQLPVATRILMIIGSYFHKFGVLIWLAMILAIFVAVPMAIKIRLRPRRPQKPYLVSRIGDFLKWNLPVLHWYENNYSTLQVIELMRLSLAAGETIDKTIAGTLDLDVNNSYRKRLQKWLSKVEAGENTAQAARQSRLPDSISWAFEQADGDYTLSVLQTLETCCRSNYSYRVNLARFIFWPCVTLSTGLVVAFVAFAVFSPMVAIVTGLANQVTP
ncbi:MAG: type II secretion system F family protein [Planctomycetes bacterium]|nr:type II secretion system F family protein [Planctomycetota bacterium]MBL7107385.1 type II secretion system F family protein [Phycisphaerae bacterium]